MSHVARFAFVLFALVCAASPSAGCSLGIPPLKDFDRTEYVFTGEVTGVVGPFESEGFQGKTWGLKVRVEEAVHLPSRPRTHFEVFPYRLWADCSTAGVSDRELERRYPVGSRVKVIAKEAELLPVRPGGGSVRLEVLPASLGSVSRNYYEDGRLMSSARGVFDYRSYKRVTVEEYTGDFMPFLEARIALPQFELRKDLLRLTGARSRAARIKILERLVYYPECCEFDFIKIANDYLGESKASGELIKKRAAWDERDAPPETK